MIWQQLVKKAGHGVPRFSFQAGFGLAFVFDLEFHRDDH